MTPCSGSIFATSHKSACVADAIGLSLRHSHLGDRRPRTRRRRLSDPVPAPASRASRRAERLAAVRRHVRPGPLQPAQPPIAYPAPPRPPPPPPPHPRPPPPPPPLLHP